MKTKSFFLTALFAVAMFNPPLRFGGREGMVKFPTVCCGKKSPELALGYNTIYYL